MWNYLARQTTEQLDLENNSVINFDAKLFFFGNPLSYTEGTLLSIYLFYFDLLIFAGLEHMEKISFITQ